MTHFKYNEESINVSKRSQLVKHDHHSLKFRIPKSNISVNLFCSGCPSKFSDNHRYEMSKAMYHNTVAVLGENGDLSKDVLLKNPPGPL